MLLLDQGVRLTHLGIYRMLVGKLNYLIVIGPDIAFAFSMVSQLFGFTLLVAL